MYPYPKEPRVDICSSVAVAVKSPKRPSVVFASPKEAVHGSGPAIDTDQFVIANAEPSVPSVVMNPDTPQEPPHDATDVAPAGTGVFSRDG